MAMDPAVQLYVSDRPVLSSLQFALSLEGFAVIDGAADETDPFAAAALVIDQGYRGDGLAWLAGSRANGCAAAAIVLATNPTVRLRARAAAAGAVLIEKPLLGEELTRALRASVHGKGHLT